MIYCCHELIRVRIRMFTPIPMRLSQERGAAHRIQILFGSTQQSKDRLSEAGLSFFTERRVTMHDDIRILMRMRLTPHARIHINTIQLKEESP